MATHQKERGQYFTPEAVARTLVSWVTRDRRCRLLDPSCGDGAFLACHPRAVGIEIDREKAALAKQRAPGALVHEADFFEWAAATRERFQIAAGNPPFIRYQRFSGAERERALAHCRRLGVHFSGLASSWAPFLVATAGLLRPDGRMAFVVPAEIGHATYARPLIEWLAGNFGHVRILAVRKKLFPHLAEDTWLLYCSDFGARTSILYLNHLESHREGMALPHHAHPVSLDSWRRADYRLRRFLLSPSLVGVYESLLDRPGVARLGTLGRAGIGYVTGANDFFHLRPSEATRLGIPDHVLRTTIRKAEQLPPDTVDAAATAEWIRRDEPVLLLDLAGKREVPPSVMDYLNTKAGQAARETYKCRSRDPWYAVPDVSSPQAFISYMTGSTPSFVLNQADCVCTNSVHAVRLHAGVEVGAVQRAWRHPLTALSCELEGHPLGGGMLKLEPGEAARVALPLGTEFLATPAEISAVAEAMEQARSWRLHA
jgi:adenine-specific DNA-methyltransferase